MDQIIKNLNTVAYHKKYGNITLYDMLNNKKIIYNTITYTKNLHKNKYPYNLILKYFELYGYVIISKNNIFTQNKKTYLLNNEILSILESIK